MEKRTPNDADDAGPLGQHHRHHWGPVSPFAWFLGCFCPPGKHERGLARLAQALHGEPCLKSFLDGFLRFLTLPGPKWVPNCAADVPVRGARARARLVQEHQLHN